MPRQVWGMMQLRDYFQLLVWISSGECVVVWVEAVLCHLPLRPQDRLWLVVLPAPDVVVGSTMSDSSAGKWVTLMFLCCVPSGLQDSCASLRSSWLLLGQLVLSCLLNFAFTHIQEYLICQWRTALGTEETLSMSRVTTSASMLTGRDAIYWGSFISAKTGTSGIAGIRLLTQTSPMSCGFLDFRHLVSCHNLAVAMGSDL